MLHYIAGILFIFAIFLLWQSTRQRKDVGIPGGEIIYSDTKSWGKVEKPLYDAKLGLAGKPDYLVREGKTIIPVEVKASKAVEGPYDSHIYQLASYCLLVEKEFDIRPPYGILHYHNRTYRIDYTQELESSLMDILAEMRVSARKKEIDRSHNLQARCKGCGYKSVCEQKI